MNKKSIWLEEKPLKVNDSLKSNLQTDVLIIGGGITGVSLAYHLMNEKLKVCLVDRDIIGHGVTARTTGKLTYLQENIYSKLLKHGSLKQAKLYLKSQKDAIKIVENIVKKENIECNLEKVSSIVYATTLDKIADLEKEKKVLNKLGINCKEIKQDNYGALEVVDTYVFHPLKYIYGLERCLIKNGVKIFEKTEIWQIEKHDDGYYCYTKNKYIKAKHVVIACHYPFFLLPFFMPLKAYVEQSCIVAYENPFNEKKSVISLDDNVVSYRYYEEANKIYKILIKGSHKISQKLDRKKQFKELLEVLIDKKPNYVWSNEDLITVDGRPYIGKIDEKLYMATGYNTWGMTNGTIAGVIIKDLILNKFNEYEKLFSPQRNFNFFSIGNSIVNAIDNGKSYIQNKLFKYKKFYNGKIKFKKENKKDLAIYDDGVTEHIVVNKCPHMGCSLIFNEVENVWECPCHASKFSVDGVCIKGPSRYNISYKK